MSQPIRYDVGMQTVTYNHSGMSEGSYPYVYPSESGEYILYSDYAALAAEYERLRSASFVTAVPSEEYERLTAENKRLRRAGDRLASATIIFETMSEEEMVQRRADWLAAKEGGAK